MSEAIELRAGRSDIPVLCTAAAADVDARWRAELLRHVGRHAWRSPEDIDRLAKSVEVGLAHSLPIFQLGETGMGMHLLEAAAKTGSDDYVAAMEMFVYEEQEHARLLALVCHRLNIDMLDEHWTALVFRKGRRVSGLRSEVLVLLMAELIATRFYKVLADGIGDRTLSDIFAAVHADEVRHLHFHAATIPRHLARWPRPVWLFARALWNLVAIGGAAVAAWDHRKILRACGSGVIRFFRDVMALRREQSSRIFR